MMKQALRVAFGFLMLWAAVLHAEVRIEITQGGLGAQSAWYRSSGPARALRRKMLAVSWRLTCATAVNSTRWIARVCRSSRPAQEVQPAAWSALGIDAVVVGQVTQTRMVLIRWRISWWIPAVRRVQRWRKAL
jgi:TolB protein